MVEGTGLENRQARKRLEGSNPSPSASNYRKRFYSQVLSVYMDGLAIFLPTAHHAHRPGDSTLPTDT